MKRREDDMLWKSIFEEVFDDLLRFLFPRADQVFDMKKGFDFLDKELHDLYPEPERRSEVRFVDKLVKVYHRNGEEEWVLIHVEIQGKYDPAFAKRMFKYYCKLFDRFDRPMTAIAVFTGKDGRRMPGMYERIFEGTQLTYKFNTLYILDHHDKDLEKSENPFALVLLAAKKALEDGEDLDGRLLKEKLLIVKILNERGLFESKKLRAIFYFLNNYVRFEKPETYRIFKEQTDIITGKKNTMGIIEQVTEIREKEAMEKGIEKGRKEGLERSRRIAQSLVADAKYSSEEIAKMTELPIDFVRKLNGSVKG